VYHAEWCLFERTSKDRARHPSMSLFDARALVQKYAPDCVVERSQQAKAGSIRATAFTPFDDGPPVIRFDRVIPRWVALHEIAHVLTPEDPGHGAAFRAVYLWLLEVEMSPWWARRLRHHFRRVGYAV
jgi:hypothetical protein